MWHIMLFKPLALIFSPYEFHQATAVAQGLSHVMFFPVPVSDSAHSTRLPTAELQNDNISKGNRSLTWQMGWFLKCFQVRQRITYLLLPDRCSNSFSAYRDGLRLKDSLGVSYLVFHKSFGKEICEDGRGMGRG